MTRQRYKNHREVAMARGATEPAWPIDPVKPRFATWSFGGGRPFNCKAGSCDRWHAGIDLLCKANDIVVTPELCTIEAVDRGWSKGSKAVFARTATGLFLVFGGTKKGSGDEWNVKEGDELPKGSPIGRVLGSYGMVHFETYEDDAYRMTNSRWYVGEPPPEGILNPLNYIQRAAGQEETIESWRQIRLSLRLLGADPPTEGPWTEEDAAALIEIQELLGLEPDGKWGPDTEERVRAELNEMGVSASMWPQVPVPVPSRDDGSGDSTGHAENNTFLYGLYSLLGLGGLAAAWAAYRRMTT